MASKILSSPLVSAFNSISSIGQSSKMASRLQSDFVSMINFIETQNAQLDAIELPDKKKIKQISNINVASTFGSPGGLLSSLVSGALDIAGFLGNFFPGRGKTGKPLPFRMPGSKTGSEIKTPKTPKITPRGSKLRFGGVKGLGVLNALFTGLDFYQGLQEGETIGKAATGAGASLAGSIVGGILGSALGPLGTFAGASLGGFVGGWLGDRAYETVTGEGQNVSKKLEQRRKKQFELQKDQEGGGFAEVVNKFDISVSKFEDFIYKSFAGMVNAASVATGSDEVMLDYGLDESSLPQSQEMPGELQDMTAEGGRLPSKSIITSEYGWRWRRLHAGIDFGEDGGMPISVIQPGQVSFAGWNSGGYGNLVQISHPGGSTTNYAHLSKISVKKGQQIEPGTVIGNVGTTGRSTANHLHFEIEVGGKKIPITRYDADKYFRFGGNVKVNPKNGPSAGSMMPQNLGSGSSEQKVMNYLIQQGLSKEQAAGIAGNLKQESGFNPKSGFNGGSHLGIAQWDRTDRWPRISKYVKSIGLDPNTLEGQLAGMVWEAKQRGNWDKIKQTKTSTEAAAYWEDKFEVSGDSPGMRGYENRLRYAREIEKSYKPPGVGGPDMPLTPSQIAAYNSGQLGLTANQIQHYPSYNRPQSSVVMMMPVDTGGPSGSAPVVPSRPSSSDGSSSATMAYSMEGEIVNSFAKIALLTNLSGS